MLNLPLSPTIMYTVPPGELTVTGEPKCKSKQEREPRAEFKPSGQTTRKPLFVWQSRCTRSMHAFT